jgi:hypothetical protein
MFFSHKERKGRTMNKVIILSGVSGSGKTSYITSRFERVWFPHFRSGDIGGAVVVSADHYFMKSLRDTFPPRAQCRYDFDPKKLSLAHGECFRNFIATLQSGRGGMSGYQYDNVIVDNTNTTECEIAPYILGAQAYGYEAEIVTMIPPKGMNDEDYIHACSERNSHGVPYSGVRSQFFRLKDRNLLPWWKFSTAESKF